LAASGRIRLPFEKELVVDLFAGGGGASTGIARAYREPDVAVNHNPIALAVLRANHPQTAHYVSDVFEVDPVHTTSGLVLPNEKNSRAHWKGGRKFSKGD
jgi:tRNA G37 N-methylase Trm5